jgi:hypothetical protein
MFMPMRGRFMARTGKNYCYRSEFALILIQKSAFPTFFFELRGRTGKNKPRGSNARPCSGQG